MSLAFPNIIYKFIYLFLAFDFCRFCVVIRFFPSPPQQPMTSDFERFSIPFFIHYINISYLNSWESASIFPYECSLLNRGTTGTIFITSLVWRGPWLGIEPGTSRTQSHHYTTRISRRRYIYISVCFIFLLKCTGVMNIRMWDTYSIDKYYLNGWDKACKWYRFKQDQLCHAYGYNWHNGNSYNSMRWFERLHSLNWAKSLGK